MANVVNAPKPKIKAFVLVRGADGVPLIAKPESMPHEMKNMLTDEDLRKLPVETVEKLGLKHRLRG